MTLSTLALFGATYLLGAMSPGPNTFIVAQRALTGSRSDALAVAAGIAAANLFLVTTALLGVAALVLDAPIVLRALQCLGGGYLAWRGVAMLRAVHTDMGARPDALPRRRWRAAREGLVTNLGNPKSFLFYAAVLSSVAPDRPGVGTALTLAVTVVVLSFTWYGLLACLLSSGRSTAPSPAFSRHVTRVSGLALIGVGLGIAATAAT